MQERGNSVSVLSVLCGGGDEEGEGVCVIGLVRCRPDTSGA